MSQVRVLPNYILPIGGSAKVSLIYDIKTTQIPFGAQSVWFGENTLKWKWVKPIVFFEYFPSMTYTSGFIN